MFSFCLKYLSLRKLHVIILISIVNFAISAQDLTDVEIKTALIYNFLKYIDHPDFEKHDTLILGVFGDDKALIKNLRKLEKQKIKGKRIQLSLITKSFSPTDIDALFLFNEYNFELTRIYRLLQGHTVLLITDRAEEKRQVMIKFTWKIIQYNLK